MPPITAAYSGNYLSMDVRKNLLVMVDSKLARAVIRKTIYHRQILLVVKARSRMLLGASMLTSWS
jgi:hypothetical protein